MARLMWQPPSAPASLMETLTRRCAEVTCGHERGLDRSWRRRRPAQECPRWRMPTRIRCQSPDTAQNQNQRSGISSILQRNIPLPALDLPQNDWQYKDKKRESNPKLANGDGVKHDSTHDHGAFQIEDMGPARFGHQ